MSALLTNWDTYKDILNAFNSEQAVGSALSEAEKSANNWAGSLNKVKNSWSELVNQFINSDNAIVVIQSVDKVIQNLSDSAATGGLKVLSDAITTIIKGISDLTDAFGTLPVALTGIAAFRGSQGKGIFGTISDDATQAGQALTIFQKKLSDIVATYKNADNGKFGEGKFAAAFNSITNNTKIDVKAVRQYNTLIEDGVDKTEAFNRAIKGTSLETQRLVQNSKTATINIGSLSAAERAAAVSAKIMGVALNMALSLGVGLLIEGIVSGITQLINAEKEATEQAENLRKQAFQNAESHKAESESVSDLYSQYINIISTVSDLSDEKEKLLEIQNKLNTGITLEKDKVDLLNSSLSENIELIKKRAYEEAKATVRDLGGEYQEALSFMGGQSLSFKDKDNLYYSSAIDRVEAILGTDVVDKLYDKIGRLQGFTIESGKGIEENILLMDKLVASYSDYLSGARDDDKLFNMYKREYDAIKQIADAYREQYSEFSTIIDAVNNAKQTIADYNSSTDSAASESINKLLEQAKELSLVINGEGDAVSRFNASQKLEDLKTQAYELAGTNSVLRDSIESVFTAIENNANISIEAIGDLKSAWFENLDEMQKGSLKTIDGMISALQKIAGGGLLSSDEFWSLAEIDVNGILNDVQLINGQFKVTEGQLIQLKDTYIQKQIDSLKTENADLAIKKQQTDELIRQAELEVQAIGRRGLSNATYRAEYEEVNGQLNQAKESSKEYGDSISRNNLLIQQLNSSLGNTVDRQKAATDLAKKAQDDVNNYAKAMTTAVQNVIDGLNNEKEQLENEKELLNNQLDVYNEQKEAIEDIVDQYKSIIDVIEDVNEAEVEALEARQEAEEKAIQEKIDSLKEQHDQQEEENSLSEKELDLRKKLADLEKAKNTKVRTYSEERGWHFDVDREVVANAQAEVIEAQKAYDKTVSDKEYNDQIKALEAEKKVVTDNYQVQINAQKDYLKQWSAIIDEQSKAESEQLAEQILGSEWREKIKNKDTDILNKYRTNFKSYNAQLNNLVNNEIASLQKSIKAKEDEIKAKNKQIESWQNYKNEVEDTINTISGKYDEYVRLLDNISLSESTSYEEREANLRNFAYEFESLVDDLHNYQSQIDDITISVNISTDPARDEMSQFIEDYKEAIESMSQALEESATGYGIVNSAWDARLADAANRMRRGYATGGTVDYTGVAMLHGSKTSAETVFNAAQSKELYNMVKSGMFANIVADKAYAGLTSAMNKMNSTTNSDNRVINIGSMVVKADNPKQFHDQFMKEIGQYWSVELTESYVK